METMVMAARADRPEHEPQAEPVLIAVEGDQAHITLDDGIELRLDHSELLYALGAGRATKHARAA